MPDEQPAIAHHASPLTGVEGRVKWFDPRKGFGFVVGPEGQDIFIHFSAIEQRGGFRTLKDGEPIVYSATYGPKGWSASEVRSLTQREQRS
jgi:cold shock protein